MVSMLGVRKCLFGVPSGSPPAQPRSITALTDNSVKLVKMIASVRLCDFREQCTGQPLAITADLQVRIHWH